MSIIEVNHVTNKYKLVQLTNLKHTALDDIAMEEASATNSFAGAASAAKTENWCLNPIDPLH